MEQITIKIPESFTGSNPSSEITLKDNFDEFKKELELIFPNMSMEKRIREPYTEPDDESAAIELERWQFNEELSKFSWGELSLDNSGVILTNYIFLTADEELFFQPILWVYMVHSNEWNYILSDVIFSFIHDNESLIPTLRDVCSEEQRKTIVKCLSMVREKLTNKTYAIMDGLNFEKEIESVDKVIDFWS